MPEIKSKYFGYGLLLAAAFGLAACDDSFDDEAKTRLYDEKQDLALEAIKVVADTCPAAVSSSALAHLSIADSRQTYHLENLYEGEYGRFAEEASSFKYYQRVSGAAGPRRTVGSAKELETAIQIEKNLAAHNVILTTTPRDEDGDHLMKATMFVDENGRKELSIIAPALDWFGRALTADQWKKVDLMLTKGAFEEPGIYALYDDVLLDSVLTMKKVQDGRNTIEMRSKKQLEVFKPQCLKM